MIRVTLLGATVTELDHVDHRSQLERNVDALTKMTQARVQDFTMPDPVVPAVYVIARPQLPVLL